MTGRTRTRIIILGVVVWGGIGCELQERDPGPEGNDLEMVRAEPPPDDSEEQGMGPVFEPPDEAPLVVGDDFWAGPATVGYELVGTFRSPEALRTSLDLERAVGPSGDRVWRLGDILVGVDYRDPGPSATWRVVGPDGVVGVYVERLQEGISERSALIELGVLPLEVRYCCAPPGNDPAPDR